MAQDEHDLESVRRAFQEFGEKDAMHAALTRRAYSDNRWDAEAFFANGRAEIARAMEQRAALLNRAADETAGKAGERGRALDFGCAVGRLTQALADHFEHVVGVDIADAMVSQARTHNRHGERVEYIVNTTPDLHLFDDASFDFVYSNKVLQHIRPRTQLRFIAEFVRVLRPGGLAAFQTRNGPDIAPGTVRERLYLLNRVHLRRLFQRIRRRTPYEMHFVARERIERTVSDAGGRVVHVDDISQERPGRSLFYWVARDA